MAELRPTIDDLILELWNVIEAHFANLPPKERYEQCSKFELYTIIERTKKDYSDMSKMKLIS